MTHSRSLTIFFNKTLPRKIDELVFRVSSSLSPPIPYFVEDKEHVTQLEGSYDLHAMAQCSPDLDPSNCTVCLELVVEQLSECCSQSRWARIHFPKCLIRYNISALQPNLASPGVVKVLTSIRDRSFLGTRTYSNATKGLSPDTAYGMYLCRGDVAKSTCALCVRTATLEISKSCTYQKEAFIYYEECMVRVSDYYFFGLLDGPSTILYSASNFSIRSTFGQTFSRKMDEHILRAASMRLSPKPYFVLDRELVKEFGSSYRLDSVVQCSPDLDPTNCTVCLRLAVQNLLGCCSLSREAHIFHPKCLVKYDTTSSPVNVPSLGAMIGNKIFGRIFIAVMTASTLALLGL
ncbi:Gnk2-homologous domain [Arabidopsis suecica]|uniref:Gnk2-homologous domain n=1 Tax=Arabidopsis suecica TaxID=45249 RepID=A0A8T2BS19_ARASU|nr:Gnk2-homologous domain [Arabidopsis suecica]